jgi:Fe2+ transport system protein FeoA
MGFTVNVELIMPQNFSRGPLLALLRDSQIALGQGEAEKVKK